MNDDKRTAKIPLLSEKEVLELGKAMHDNKDDELATRRFWKVVYEKRGLEYKK